MESLGYLLVYFLTGNLPWSKKYARVKKKHRRNLYGKCKVQTPVEELTQGLPSSFAKYFTNVSQLAFTDRPNYDYYRSLFIDILTENGYTFDHVFDWTLSDEDADKSSTESTTATSTKSRPATTTTSLRKETPRPTSDT